MNRERGSSSRKKAIVAVLVGVILIIAGYGYDTLVNKYSLVRYWLSGPEEAYPGTAAPMVLYLQNEGTIDAVPISKVYVVNATIQNVSFPYGEGYPNWRLAQYSFNSTTAMITNVTIPCSLPIWFGWVSIYVVPNEGTPTFGVYSLVSLSSDSFHPRSSVERIDPYELIYKAKMLGPLTYYRKMG